MLETLNLQLLNLWWNVYLEGKRGWVAHLSSVVLQFPKDLFGKHKTVNPKEYSKLMQKSMQDIDKRTVASVGI
jgi:hypothetical protein